MFSWVFREIVWKFWVWGVGGGVGGYLDDYVGNMDRLKMIEVYF